MLHFYHELIGLPISRTAGPADDPQTVWLPGVQLVRQTETSPAGGQFDHVGLGVRNIEEVCARLDAEGCEVDTPLQRRSSQEVGRDLMLAFYRDPEGNRVEFVKYL